MIKPKCSKLFMSLVAIAATISAQAETLNVMVSPWGDGVRNSINPEPLCGTLSGLVGSQTDISSSPGILSANGFGSTKATSDVAVYRIKFSKHPQFGDISFDLTVTASVRIKGGGHAAGLLYNGTNEIYWTVDSGDNSYFGAARDEKDDEHRIHSAEFITFEVSNLRSVGNTISFKGFTGLEISQGGSFNKNTGVFTGSGSKGGRIKQIQFQLDISAPRSRSTAVLLDFAGVSLALRPRK